jgi:hypothetical protein
LLSKGGAILDNKSLPQFPELTDFMFILDSRFDDYVVHMIEMPSLVEAEDFCQSLSFFGTSDDAGNQVCFDSIENLAGVKAVALVGGPLSCKENIEVRRSAESKGANCMSFCNADAGSRTYREFLAAGRSLQRGPIKQDKKAIQKRKKELQKRKKARERKNVPWWRFW